MNVMGLYSGIDMSMVDQIMEAEAAKGKRFTTQKENYTNSQNAWKDMNTRLDSLYKHLDDLQNAETFNSKSVDMTGPENVKVTASTSAATGNYRLQVSQLATQTRLTGKQVNKGEDIGTALGQSGTLRLNAVDIEITETDSLRSISEKINQSSDKTGVSSNIIDNRLVLTHTEYGETDITVEGGIANALGLEGVDAVKGQGSQFYIDGLMIERSSNVVDDVIEGLSIQLTNTHEGNDSTVVSITEDMDKAAETLQAFVDQYNSTQSFITSQLSVGDPSAANNKTGTLAGDGTLMRLQSSLRSMVTSRDDQGTLIKGLQDLGVSVDRSGTASFDRTKMETQIKTNPNEVKDFFSSSSRVTDAEGETSTVTKGFSRDMRSLVNQYISSSDGIIKTRQDSYDRMIRDVNQRIERFDERLAMRKDRYIKQFSALDTAMMQAESQMNFMFSQLGME